MREFLEQQDLLSLFLVGCNTVGVEEMWGFCYLKRYGPYDTALDWELSFVAPYS